MTELEAAIEHLKETKSWRECITDEADEDAIFKVIQAATRTAELEKALRWYAVPYDEHATTGWQVTPTKNMPNVARDALGEG